MFDLTLFPLTIISGREQYDLPGLLAVSAPRKSERMRAQDQLLLFMHLVTPSGEPSAFTHAQQKEILSRLAETYFNSPGSVTAGLRATAARLNDFLLNRNLKAGQASQSGQTMGSLTLAVAHASSLYVAHCGPTHTYFLNQNQVQHFDDGQGMRGLGLSRQAVPRFYQISLAAGDMLVLCANPPAAMARSLVGSLAVNFDTLRRRMVSEAAGDLQAAFLRFSAGKGQVTYWRPAAKGEPGTTKAQAGPAAKAEQAAQTELAASAAAPVQTGETPAPHPDRFAKMNDAAEAAIAQIGASGSTAPAEPSAVLPGQPAPAGSESAVVDIPSEPSEPTPGALFFSVPPTPVEPEGQPKAEPAIFLGRGAAKNETVPPPTPRPARRGLLEVLRLPRFGAKPSTGTPGDQTAEGKPASEAQTSPSAQERAAAIRRRTFPGSVAAQTPAEQTGATSPGAAPRHIADEPNRTGETDSVVVSPPPQEPAPRRPLTSTSGSRIVPATDRQPGLPSAEQHAASGESGRQFVRSTSVEQASPAHGSTAALPRHSAAPAQKTAGPSLLQTFGRSLSTAWRGGRETRAQVGKMVGGATAKVLPKRSEPLINLSPSALLMIAILVPVMVVTVATTVYFRAGRSEQFTILLGQAKQYAKQAATQQDPVLLKQSWTSTYNLLNEAQKYGSSEEADALRKKAEVALDEMQGITRLDFQPAVTDSFGLDVNIIRMVATLNQVFLLDSNRGRILSMTRVTSGGFEANQYFTCSPAKAGGAIVGPLIDMAEIPINNELGAEIMGIDGGGNLVYCASGQEGFDSQSLALPDIGWGQITAITTYGDTLYVLDPPNNAVYRYDGDKGIFAGKPHLYFDQDIPKMKDVIDIAVDQEFLYMLHADGSMTTCSSGGVSFGNTRCSDPTLYGDPRPGSEPNPLVFPGSQLTQLQTTQPPDPSLFALDPANRAIYHLSQRRLNLQRVYLNKTDSDYPYPNKAATAFAITPNRRALIAFGNQLFFASLP